jgi:dolichol kinase
MKIAIDSRRAGTSLALIILICFFLPWVQLSCGTSENRLSGVDLARDGDSALYLIPFLMLSVLFFGIVRAWKDKRAVSAIVTLVAGLISAYLMNRERMRAEDTSGLIAVGLTAWFWLGFGSTIGLVIVSVLRFLKRPREP